MEYQHYLYLKSDDSLNFYPTNSPGKFYSKLPQSLHLQGLWECALLQLQYVHSYFGDAANIPNNLLFCSNICTESIVSDRKIPILRRVCNVLQSGLTNQVIEVDIKNLIYVPVVCEYIDVISIYITDEHGKYVSFSKGPLHTTLHLRHMKSF